MKKQLLSVAFILSAGLLIAQKRIPISGGLYLHGGKLTISSGAYVVVDGNQSGMLKLDNSSQDATISLDGKLSIDGSFTNNTSSQPFSSLASGSEVIFAGAFGTQTIGGTSTTVFNFDKLTVNSGATVVVTAGKKVTASNTFTNNGSFKLLNTGSGPATLLTDGSVAGSGTFAQQIYVTGAGGGTPNGRRWYVSSPVAGATSNSTTAASNKLWSYAEATYGYDLISNNVTALNVLSGYVVRQGATGNLTFSGTAFNTGALSASSLSRTSLTHPDRGYHLIGNPYPSVYAWENAVLTNVSSTYYVKTPNLSSTMITDSYNATTHIGTNNNGSTALTQYLAPGQGIWVEATSNGGQIDFSNTGRSHTSTTLRGIENSMIRLNVYDGINSDQTIVNFDANATTDFEAYDSKKWFMNQVSEIYTTAGNESLVINSLPEVTEETRVPVSANFKTTGNFSMYAEQITGELINRDVYLEDKQSNTLHLLSDNAPYNFQATAGTETDRFALVFKKRSAGLETIKEAASIVIYNVDRTINIHLANAENGTLNVFDMSGRIVASHSLTASKSVIELQEATGVYTVEVVSGKDRKVTKIALN